MAIKISQILCFERPQVHPKKTQQPGLPICGGSINAVIIHGRNKHITCSPKAEKPRVNDTAVLELVTTADKVERILKGAIDWPGDRYP
jgi:hypothetical protein